MVKNLIFVLLIFCGACNQSYEQSTQSPRLDDYWYQGKAEVSTYALTQNRYRDEHPGEVTLLQVSEDFLTDKQVKNDHRLNKNSVSVLKSNLLSKFTTGVYDYSVMTSVFTNADAETLKLSNSVQDWCGHTWLQANKKSNTYKLTGHSYFENENEQSVKINDVFLEDEIFNLIRILKKEMPTGSVQMLPSAQTLRMLHLPLVPIQADLKWVQKFDGVKEDSKLVYQISMPQIQRTIKILIDPSNNFSIEGWTDAYPSVFDKKIRTTKAVLRARKLIDYWNKNAKSDESIRNEMQLTDYKQD